MKRTLILVATGAAMLIIGFFSGRAFQHAETGYHYKLLDQKEYASGLGPIQWSCFLESVGLPFLDPEKTMISMGNRTIYKAQRDFQESAPYAKNIETSGNSISWDDGDFHYHLTVVPTTNSEPNNSSDAGQPIRSETNHPSSPLTTPPSGKQIKITGIGPMHFPNGTEAMILNCETDISINDMPNLRKQADEIWSSFRKNVEEAGMTNAVIRITHPEGSGFVTHSKGYGFVFEKRADGQWHCLQDEKQ